MKRTLISIVAVVLLLFNTIAYAAEGTEQVSAGITPDSILYTADKLFEDLKLMITFDSEKEASLLLQFAQERLAEAKEMTESEKAEFVETAVKDYMVTIEKAQEKVLEVVTDENKDAEIKEELTQELNDTTEVSEKVEENLDDVVKEELENKTEEVKYTARVVENIDPLVVKGLREKDMGFGQIAQIALLADMSGKSVDEVSKLFTEEGKGLGSAAKELGIHPSEIKKKIVAKTSETTVEADKEDEEDKDKENTEVLTDNSKDQTNDTESKQIEDKIENDDKKEVVVEVSKENLNVSNIKSNVELKGNQGNSKKELDVVEKKEIKAPEAANKSEKEAVKITEKEKKEEIKITEKEKKEEIKIEQQNKKEELKKEHQENKGKKR